MGLIAGWVSLKCCMLVYAHVGSPKSACGVQLLHIKVNTYLGHLWPSVTSQDRQRAQPRDFVTFFVCWVWWSIPTTGYWSGFALWMTKAVTMLWLGGNLSGSQKPPPCHTLCLMMLPELIVSSKLSQDGSYGPSSHLLCWLKQSSITHHQFSSLFISHYKLPKERKRNQYVRNCQPSWNQHRSTIKDILSDSGGFYDMIIWCGTGWFLQNGNNNKLIRLSTLFTSLKLLQMTLSFIFSVLVKPWGCSCTCCVLLVIIHTGTPNSFIQFVNSVNHHILPGICPTVAICSLHHSIN